MLKQLKKLLKEFMEPDPEYSPIPLWFWNDDLEDEEIIRQIREFKAKGVLGFLIHPRLGITQNIQYLSKNYFTLVKTACNEAYRQGMLVYLYDEASYPSGSAHGMVVQGNPEFASRGLRMQEYKCDGPFEIPVSKAAPRIGINEELVSVQAAVKTADREIELESVMILEPAEGKIRFNPPDDRPWSVLIFVHTPTYGKIRGVHLGEDDWEPGALPSADILNPDAVRKFISLTHEKYYSELKEYFGSTVKAIFTDEPSIMGRRGLPGLKPWTYGFLDFYKNAGGSEADLAALWLECPQSSHVRIKYSKAVNSRLETAYYKQISDWCEEHSIALTGHPGHSEDIGLLKHFQIPCQDIVWRWVAPEDNLAIDGTDSTMGKCSSDSARHYGKRRNGNEVFGCCFRKRKPNAYYDLPPEDIKWYLDWLFIRGVNLMMPHAFYYSVRGDRRLGERPPDVGPNNLFWPYYNIVADYIKRMSWVMTDSANTAEIAVLCREDRLPWKIVKPLFQNQIEFNYLEDNLLVSGDAQIVDGRIKLCKQEYSTIIVEASDLLENENTVERLKAFVKEGGRVILTEDCGDCAISGSIKIGGPTDIVNVLDTVIEREVMLVPGNCDLRVSHVKKGGTDFFVLVNEGEAAICGEIGLRAEGAALELDALNGSIHKIAYTPDNKGCNWLKLRLSRRQSIIYCISKETAECDYLDPILPASGFVEVEELSCGWEAEGPGISIKLGKLESWTLWEGLQEYSGYITYSNRFTVNNRDKLKSVTLDLGTVNETAELFINGQPAGVRLWGPYKFDITALVTQGENIIEVKVINSLANKLNKACLDSGLLGPCRLIRESM